MANQPTNESSNNSATPAGSSASSSAPAQGTKPPTTKTSTAASNLNLGATDALQNSLAGGVGWIEKNAKLKTYRLCITLLFDDPPVQLHLLQDLVGTFLNQ